MIWLSIYFFSIFWVAGLPFILPNLMSALIFIVAGLGASILAFPNSRFLRFGQHYFLLFFLAALSFSLLMPFPYKATGIIALSCSILIVTRVSGTRLSNSRLLKIQLVLGLLWSIVILVIQHIGVYVYYLFAPHLHTLPAITPLLNSIFKMAGIECSHHGTTLFMFSGENWEFGAAAEKLAFLFMILFWCGAVFVSLISKHFLKNFVTSTVIIIVYSFIRYTAMIGLVMQFENFSLFWNVGFTALTFSPMVILFQLLVVAERSRERFKKYVSYLSQVEMKFRSVVGLILLSGLIIFLSAFSHPGTRKEGRVLFLQTHSDWEWTHEPPGTEVFDVKSMYNYYGFRDYLDHFYEASATTNTITTALLDEYDVIIITTPTAPYSEDEIDMLERYVQRGGGLILIGDHTNVFGTTTHMNPILARFSMKLLFDCTYDLKTTNVNVFKSSQILPHVMLHNIPTFVFASSCTIATSLLNERIIVGHSVKTARGDYAQRSFFPGISKTTDYDFGLFHQATARNYGRGRVVVFTDNTVFSNFCFYLPYRYHLALNMVEWANRREVQRVIQNILLILLIGVVLFLIAKSNRTGVGRFLLVIVTLFIAVFPLTIAIVRCAHSSLFSLTEQRRPFRKAVFEREYSKYYLPIHNFDVLRLDIQNYDDFYSNAQRVGFTPAVSDDLESALGENPELIVIIDPAKPFSWDILTLLKKYLENGGSLLIMDDPENKDSTAPQVLEAFGLSLKGIMDKTVFKPTGAKEPVEINHCYRIEGAVSSRLGEGIIFKNYGQGIVSVFGKSSIFSKSGMQKSVYDEEIPVTYPIDIQRLQVDIYRSLAK